LALAWEGLVNQKDLLRPLLRKGKGNLAGSTAVWGMRLPSGYVTTARDGAVRITYLLTHLQLHWTKETEDDLDGHGIAGAQMAVDRQNAQLKDMVVLVRGELTKQVREISSTCVVFERDNEAIDVLF
jgi:hypothetical protein